MTRKEEILQAANNYKTFFPDGFISEFTYIDGAEWADRSMLDKAIKFFQSKSKHGMIEENINEFIDEFCKVVVKGE